MDESQANDDYYDTDLEQEEAEERERQKQASTKPYPEGENFAKLCMLFSDGAAAAMKQIFDQIHPPISLVERLAKSSVHKSLRRLKVQGLIPDSKWQILYPEDKRKVSSNRYDPVLVFLLLKNVCHITAPYPNGWDDLPEDKDHSLGAELVRLNYYLSTLVNLSRVVTDQEYKLHFKYLTAIIMKISSVGMTSKFDKIDKTKLQDTRSQEIIIQPVTNWYEEAEEIRRKEKKVQQIMSLRGSDHELIRLSTNTFDTNEDTVSEVSNWTRSSISTTKSKGLSSTSSSPSKSRATFSRSTSSSVDPTSKGNVKQLEKQIIHKYQKQLTESISAEDVVNKMVQRGILSHEEKNKIQLQTMNSTRMKMLFDIMMRKSGNAFDVFCDVIKFKYKGVYNILTEAKKAPFLMNKPDEATECAVALKSYYREMVSNMYPIPWNSNIQMPLHQFYQSLYLTDLQGRILEPTEVFQPHGKSQKPKRILIQGDGGAGKSTMAKYFLSEWSKGTNESLNEKVKLAFYVDLKKATSGDLCTTLIEQCLPFTYQKTSDELFNLIKGTQKRTLFILDGYEYLRSIDDEFLDLLHKSLFKDCYIIVLVKSQFVTTALQKLFDTKLAVLGLRNDNRRELVKNYIEFTETPREHYDYLLVKIDDQDPSAINMFSLNPLYCLCMCLIAQHEGIFDFKTLTFMLQAFISALEAHFCNENNIKLTSEGVPPEGISQIIAIFEELSFEHLMNNQYVLNMQDILRKHRNEDIKHFGLFSIYTKTSGGKILELCEFHNVLFQEILAARFLLRIELEDFPRYVEHLTKETHLHNMTILFCGLQYQDYDSETVPAIFEALKEVNLHMWKALSHDKDSERYNNKFQYAEGRLSHFELSLQCLNESKGRRDMAKYIVESLPSKMYMKSKDIINNGTVSGLGYVLKENSPILVELDLRLNHFGNYYAFAMQQLAQGIETSAHIDQLRLRWTSDGLLALFLANIFGENSSISSLKIYDESKMTRDNISATVWSNFWSARKGMQNIQTFSFLSCQNPALVTSVVRNIPENLEELYLNGCTIDMIAAQELSKKFEQNPSLKLVSLNGTRFKKPDFLHITNGIKHTQSLAELNLGDTDLDPTSTLALAEAIKFNKSLRRLDLAGASFNNEGCRTMGLALALNKTILEVNIQGALITKDGVEEIKKMKREGVTITGNGKTRKKSKF